MNKARGLLALSAVFLLPLSACSVPQEKADSMTVTVTNDTAFSATLHQCSAACGGYEEEDELDPGESVDVNL